MHQRKHNLNWTIFHSVKMGRKIPGKKHKTIKDPYKQRETRLERVKNKINNPPRNPDEQEVPKSFLKLMELKKTAKLKIPTKVKKNKRKKNKLLSLEKVLDKDPILRGMKRADGFIPKLVQKQNESEKSFLRRVNLMTQNLIDEAEYEDKFGVEIRKNAETGEVIEVKKVKRNRKSKKKKLTEKRKEKTLKRIENENSFKDFNQFKDNIEFGEVVHRPPTLPDIKKKNKNTNSIESPKFSNLLLSKISGNVRDHSKTKPKSNLEKEKSEMERKFIVEAYRKAKNKI